MDTSRAVEVAIVFHSARGHTALLAEAARRGVMQESGARAELLRVDALDAAAWETLERADALIFGSPTYMGGVSSAFKKFAEDSLTAWADDLRWRSKIAAGFTHSQAMSGDKLHTLQYFSILAGQHGMLWVSLDLLPGWCSSSGSDTDLNRLGGWLGAMSRSDGERAAEKELNVGDVRTVEHLGRRVARVAHELLLGRAARTSPKTSG